MLVSRLFGSIIGLGSGPCTDKLGCGKGPMLGTIHGLFSGPIILSALYTGRVGLVSGPYNGKLGPVSGYGLYTGRLGLDSGFGLCTGRLG